jgi:hypothetical protein
VILFLFSNSFSLLFDIVQKLRIYSCVGFFFFFLAILRFELRSSHLLVVLASFYFCGKIVSQEHLESL